MLKLHKDKKRASEVFCNAIHFLASFWISCLTTFEGIPLNLISLDWLLFTLKGGGYQGEIFLCIFTMMYMFTLYFGDSEPLTSLFWKDFSSFLCTF